MRRLVARFTKLTAALAALAVLAWIACEAAVEIASAGRCYDDLSKLPARPAALVLGTAKFVRGGRENIHYRYRIDAAARLFRAGKVRRIIVSGNGSEAHYNEPLQMQEDLVKLGVPADRIIRDDAGLRTLDSVVRASTVFDQPDCIVVSQPSHNERAIFLDRAMGGKMIAWNARNVPFTVDPRTAVRERLARILAVLDVTVLDNHRAISDSSPIRTASAPR
jgi:Uncharacterized membrane protein